MSEIESEKKEPPAHMFYTIPAGTQGRMCDGRTCRMTIWKVLTKKGELMPVDCMSHSSCELPTETRDGRGIAHWGYCPDRKQFSKR
jgi:hypothetical protein